MRGALSPRVAGLLALAGAACLGGLIAGRPELVVLAAAPLVVVGVGLAGVVAPDVRFGLRLAPDRLLEGTRTHITIELHNAARVSVELELGLTRSRWLVVEPEGLVTLRLPPGGRFDLEVTATPRRWGAHAVGPLIAQARDPVGLVTWRQTVGDRRHIRAFPREESLRALVAPRRTQPFLGAHVARRRGAGIEFADVRPFAAGDRVRHVNWRVTARRGALYVSERHPEHSSDVVLLLDTFAEARDMVGGTLDTAVRATASLARAHLARRDRVALVDFGGTLHWLEPAFGATQLYRIVDALLSSEIAFSYAGREVGSIPRRVLPPGALILAITPLLDERSIRLVTELRQRGADVTVVEVSPLRHVTPPGSPGDALAHRLWRLEREALRARLQSLGIAVALWEEPGTLGPALQGVNAFRRSARHVARV